MLYVFLWVIPQRLNFICQRFGKETATWNTIHWSLPPHGSLSSPQHARYLLHTCTRVLHVGRCPPQPVFLLGLVPTLSPYFRLAQAIFKRTFSCVNTPTFSASVILHTYPPMKMEQTECSKTLAYKIQMPGSYPEESIQQCVVLLNEHSEEFGVLPLMHGVAAVARHLLSFWSVTVYHIVCKSWTLALQSLKADTGNHHIVAL